MLQVRVLTEHFFSSVFSSLSGTTLLSGDKEATRLRKALVSNKHFANALV